LVLFTRENPILEESGIETIDFLIKFNFKISAKRSNNSI